MSKKSLFVLILSVVTIALFIAPTPATADTCSTLVTEVSWKFISVDSKVGGGYWAYDTILSNAEIYDCGEGTYRAVINQTGMFESWGSGSPGNTGTIEGGVEGSIVGTMTVLFQGADPTDLSGFLGEFDFGCDHDANCSSYVSWRDLLFDSYESYSYEFWEWLYTTCDGRAWLNSQNGNEGDILGGPIYCPPDIKNVPLIDMYVFYSESGFFGPENGRTNTCTLYSHEDIGEPAPERILYWCGETKNGDDEKSLPDDYYLACSAVLIDDDTDKGKFGCDGFLKLVGERRAYLRHDPQGPEFNLEPKIRAYVRWLKDEGLIK